jgi:hypothetical protein
MTTAPRQIFIIRHAEKPVDDATNSEPPFGIDINGNPNPHSLTPRGWQRSGALTDLFDPAIGPIRSGLAVPERLYRPGDTHAKKTLARRTTKPSKPSATAVPFPSHPGSPSTKYKPWQTPSSPNPPIQC